MKVVFAFLTYAQRTEINTSEILKKSGRLEEVTNEVKSVLSQEDMKKIIQGASTYWQPH